jgi:N-acetylglucosaminyldiphosphoundecaprenol N-acetyl-beta-D-mannosaminyltransferase
MRPDFARHVYCVLGLPFDAISESEAVRRIRDAAGSGRRCFLSTPNLNFAIGCASDAAFRHSVLQSDLSVADGWPIVAIARLIGAPLPERVTGSGLFERLVDSAQRPSIKVYFFGGPPGSAGAASERLNVSASGVTCVGFDEPGFGSVEDMSTPERIGRINMSAPDFVVVAIGAKKGQAWIQHNLTRITAPVIGYLGAVVNFAAGTVSRAPRWAQAARLEWLWRIVQEPALWRRYANDGFALSKLMLTRVIPGAIDHWLARRASNGASTPPSLEQGDERAMLKLSGTWTASRLPELRPLLAAISESGLSVELDLRDAGRIDSAVIASLLLLYGWQLQSGLGWRVINPSDRSRRSLHLAGAGYLLESR